MSGWAWAGVGYAVGAIGTCLFNVGTLILSGGYITRPFAIARNAVLWPVMLPLLVLDWLENS